MLISVDWCLSVSSGGLVNPLPLFYIFQSIGQYWVGMVGGVGISGVGGNGGIHGGMISDGSPGRPLGKVGIAGGVGISGVSGNGGVHGGMIRTGNAQLLKD